MNETEPELFLWRYSDQMLQHTGEHLVLVGISTVIAIGIGIPLGIVITRQPKLSRIILGLANIFQTVPSLALFGFLISVPLVGGIGARPAILALMLYSLLPIIRNTYAGITSVDPSIREAGKGMGMTDWQLLWQVEIPLAMGVILAGVRVATVIAIGTATISAAIGAGGLGSLIFQGLSRANPPQILAGAIPAAFMALLVDFILGKIERQFVSKRGN